MLVKSSNAPVILTGNKPNANAECCIDSVINCTYLWLLFSKKPDVPFIVIRKGPYQEKRDGPARISQPQGGISKGIEYLLRDWARACLDAESIFAEEISTRSAFAGTIFSARYDVFVQSLAHAFADVKAPLA